MRLYNLPIIFYFLQSLITTSKSLVPFTMATFAFKNSDLLPKRKSLAIKLKICSVYYSFLSLASESEKMRPIISIIQMLFEEALSVIKNLSSAFSKYSSRTKCIPSACFFPIWLPYILRTSINNVQSSLFLYPGAFLTLWEPQYQKRHRFDNRGIW